MAAPKAQTERLIISQRVNGVEPRGAFCGQIAEQHSDEHRDAESCHDGVEGRADRDVHAVGEHGQDVYKRQLLSLAG